MMIRPTGAATLLTCLLVLASCGGDEQAERDSASADASAAEATADDQTSTSDADDAVTTGAELRIPDGRYVRVVTAADAEGYDVSPEQVEEFLGRDGELTMALEIQGERFKQYSTNDAGVEEVGDLGTLAYPEEGRVVVTSESTGCPGCVTALEWSLDGNDFIQESVEAPAPENFLFNGRWTREDGPTAEGDGTSSSGQSIPDGRYVRVATAADAEGLDLTPEQVAEFVGRDGELPMAVEIEGERWSHYVSNDAGVEELGDLGTVHYPEEGQLVITSQSAGCPGCVRLLAWRLDGTALVLDPVDQLPDEAFHTRGRWTREDG